MKRKGVTATGTPPFYRVAWPLAILALLVLSCIPASPRTSGTPSFITARSLEQLVEESAVIAIARLEGAEEEINRVRDPDNPTRASQDSYVLGQVYRLRVERYLKGEGPDAIRVVQSEAWDYGGLSRMTSSSRQAIQRLRQEALEGGWFIPFESDTTYLLFLRPLGVTREDDYLVGVREPWRFVLAEDGQASPDSPWGGAELSFPARPAEELLGEVEGLLEGAPTATPSVHFITFASPEEIEEELRATPTVPGEIRMRVYMTAEAVGELTVVNDCLYIQAIGAPNRQLLIWPPELYALDEREGTVRILDARSGEELVRVGDRIHVGGGGLVYEHLSDRVRAQIPADCPGPYWAAGLGLERWEPTPTPGASSAYPPSDDAPEGSEDEPTMRLNLEKDGDTLLAFFAGEPELQGAFGGIYLEHVAGSEDHAIGVRLVLQLVRGHEKVDEIPARLPPLRYPERLRIEFVGFSDDALQAQFDAISGAVFQHPELRAVSMDRKNGRVVVLIAPSDARKMPDGTVDKASLPADLAALLAHPAVIVREGMVHEELSLRPSEGDAVDTPEAREIVATILEVYRLYDVVDRTLDVSGFDDVLINAPSVPLTALAVVSHSMYAL